MNAVFHVLRSLFYLNCLVVLKITFSDFSIYLIADFVSSILNRPRADNSNRVPGYAELDDLPHPQIQEPRATVAVHLLTALWI